MWHTRDHRFLSGPDTHPLWALDYWPAGLYTRDYAGPVQITVASLDHAQALIELIVWAETEGALS